MASHRRAAARGTAGLLAALALACLVLAGVPPRAALAITLLPNPDSYTVRHDHTRTVAAPGVLANDVGLLGSSTAVLYSDVSHGDLSLQSDGSFTYEPDAGYVGTDSFRYRARDLLLYSVPATVTISVTNAAPVVVADQYTAKTGVELSVPAPGVLANDTDADGDDLSAELLDGGGNGSIDLNSNGSFTFKSGGSFVGQRTFTYRVWDGLAWSAPATVTITVGSATPTPTPTPSPTPSPTPTPSPPTPLPTVVVPLPTLPIPLPSLPLPLPTVRVPVPSPTLPLPTVREPLPTATPTPTRSAAPSTAPSGALPEQSASPAPSDGGNGGGPTTPEGPNGPGVVNVPPIDPFTPIDGIGTINIGGFDWAVPSLVLSVPGLLLILAVIAQTGAGMVTIPVVRRSLRGSGLSRRAKVRPGR
jgi:hypothetical protein